MNTSNKECNFSMKERSNDGMIQRRIVNKVTFFVPLINGMYVVSDCISMMTGYMLKMTMYKRYMMRAMYSAKRGTYSVKNGKYINRDDMKFPTEYMLKPIGCNCSLYVITNELNIWKQASIEMLYGMNICIEAGNEMLYGMNIWIQTMNIYKSYIDNYNQNKN